MTDGTLRAPREPRPHQSLVMGRLRAALLAGKRRPCLQLATGGGKTYLASWIARGALAKGGRVVFTVPALSLIDQTVAAFEAEGLAHVGVIQADHPRTDATAPVQVASVQTLSRRALPPATVVVVDECHRDAPIIRRWMREAPEAFFIGLTATPGRPGMDREYDALVRGPAMADLIEAGVLSRFQVFAASHPDLTGVRTTGGDYQQDQLSEAMSKGAMVADIVAQWLSKGGGGKTLCFAVDLAHARKIQADFEAAGVSCGYVDGSSGAAERSDLARRFHAGDLPVVVNVGCLTTGVDWDVRCIILARPTKSEMLYVQMIGRGLRTAPGKDLLTVLDHSDTTLRLGLVTDIAFDGLPPRRKGAVGRGEARARAPLPRECPQCSAVRPASVFACPACGHAPIQVLKGDLVRVEPGRARPSARTPMVEKQRWFSELLSLADETDRKRGWASHRYRDRFGVWPNGLSDDRAVPSPDVRAFAQGSRKAYLAQFGKLRA